MKIEQIIAEHGAVYKAEGQGVKDLMSKLMQKSVTAAYFATRITEKTVLEKAVGEVSRVLQRFQKDWTPIGEARFEPVKIPLFKLKIDLQETPDDLEESWLGFLADENLDRTKWPFIKWFLEKATERANQDYELNEIYNGIAKPIVKGKASEPGESMDGIKVIINRGIKEGKITPYAMGAVPAEPKLFVEYIENMIKKTPRVLRNQLDNVFMNEDNHDLFRDGMREKYNVNYQAIDDVKITTLRNNNIKVVGLPSMAGSSKIFSTPAWNRQSGFKKPNNENIFKVENVDRTVKAYTDYYKGVGFWIPEYMVTNDQDLIVTP